jgi:hypothetical protein
MTGRIFDDDLTAASNLNRNMLSTILDIGKPKVSVAQTNCVGKLCLEPINRRFVAVDVSTINTARTLVGVDHIPSRWEAQRATSGWIGVGGTSHFSISSSEHSPGEPCSGCLHPIDDSVQPGPIPTISYVSFWAGLAMAVRIVRHALGNPYSATRQHLWLTPLRMDLPNAGMWTPIPRRSDCPIRCSPVTRNHELGVKF